MEWPKRARTADWENGVLALDREKQFEVPKLTAEIMERLAGYTLVGFHVKGYPVTDELLAPFAGHKSMVNFGVLVFGRMAMSKMLGILRNQNTNYDIYFMRNYI